MKGLQPTCGGMQKNRRGMRAYCWLSMLDFRQTGGTRQESV